MIKLGICATCIHRKEYDSCAAFKEIPPAILLGSIDHRRPIEGDHGIIYQKKEQAA